MRSKAAGGCAVRRATKMIHLYLEGEDGRVLLDPPDLLADERLLAAVHHRKSAVRHLDPTGQPVQLGPGTVLPQPTAAQHASRRRNRR